MWGQDRKLEAYSPPKRTQEPHIYPTSQLPPVINAILFPTANSILDVSFILL